MLRWSHELVSWAQRSIPLHYIRRVYEQEQEPHTRGIHAGAAGHRVHGTDRGVHDGTDRGIGTGHDGADPRCAERFHARHLPRAWHQDQDLFPQGDLRWRVASHDHRRHDVRCARPQGPGQVDRRAEAGREAGSGRQGQDGVRCGCGSESAPQDG